MLELSPTAYLWIKALHVISVIAWMAGLLYLPRLFVYHAEAPQDSDQAKTFLIMERRLLKAITTPAMIASLVFGGLLMAGLGSGIWSLGWWWLKVPAIVGLLVYHGLLYRWHGDFAGRRNSHSGKFFRAVNEVPTVLMVVIVVAVIVRPF